MAQGFVAQHPSCPDDHKKSTRPSMSRDPICTSTLCLRVSAPSSPGASLPPSSHTQLLVDLCWCFPGHLAHGVRVCRDSGVETSRSDGHHISPCQAGFPAAPPLAPQAHLELPFVTYRLAVQTQWSLGQEEEREKDGYVGNRTPCSVGWGRGAGEGGQGREGICMRSTVQHPLAQ